ncbi:unnamed protein product [Boreogadus saida]
MFLEEIEDHDDQLLYDHSSPAVAQYGTTTRSPLWPSMVRPTRPPLGPSMVRSHSSPAVAQYVWYDPTRPPAVAQYGTTHSSPAVAQYGTTHSSPAVAQYGTTQVPSVLQPRDEEQDSYLQPLSSPGSPEGPPAPGSLAAMRVLPRPSPATSPVAGVSADSTAHAEPRRRPLRG